MKKRIAAALLGLLGLGWYAAPASAGCGFFCRRDCSKVCIKPYNAFSPALSGVICAEGCQPFVNPYAFYGGGAPAGGVSYDGAGYEGDPSAGPTESSGTTELPATEAIPNTPKGPNAPSTQAPNAVPRPTAPANTSQMWRGPVPYPQMPYPMPPAGGYRPAYYPGYNPAAGYGYGYAPQPMPQFNPMMAGYYNAPQPMAPGYGYNYGYPPAPPMAGMR